MYFIFLDDYILNDYKYLHHIQYCTSCFAKTKIYLLSIPLGKSLPTPVPKLRSSSYPIPYPLGLNFCPLCEDPKLTFGGGKN